MTCPLGVWTRYGELGASSRLRFFACLPLLRAAGFEPCVHAFFSDDYLRNLYAGGGKSRTAFGKALCRRLPELFRLPECNLIEYELLPFLPARVEAWFLKNRKYVLNFDDAVWCKYQRLPFLRKKFEQLAAHAAGIVAANEELQKHLASYNANCLLLPTAIPLPELSGTAEKFPEFTVGWIGTPVTYAYLQQHAEALRAMSCAVPCRFLVIAGKELPEIPGVPVTFAEWSRETEWELLRRCHVGIMPLPDDDFARGKSGFKLIQYAAAGLPAIASPVGENRRILRENETGFFAETPREWADALSRLAAPELQKRFGANARREAQKYDLQNCGQELAAFLQRCFGENA